MTVGPYLDIAMLAALCAALLAGFPVAFTLAGVALIFAFIGWGAGVFDPAFLGALPSRLFGGIVWNEVLVAVPLFIFMGVMLERSKVAEDLLEAMGALFGRLRGGLGISVTLVGMLLAASTGIVGATVVTMGLLSLPTMLKHGYAKPFACGTICAAGTLGQIIPPSIVLVILGDQLSNAYIEAQRSIGNFAPEPLSVGDLFAGALIPGLLLVGLYILYQIGVAWVSPASAPSIAPAGGMSAGASGTPAVGRALRALAPPLVLIVAVLGTILAGAATPSEAAAVGAVGATLLAGLRLRPNGENGGKDAGEPPCPDHEQGTLVTTISGGFCGLVTGAILGDWISAAPLPGLLLGLVGGALAARLGWLARGLRALDPAGSQRPILAAGGAVLLLLLLRAAFDLRWQRESVPLQDGIAIAAAVGASLVLLWGLAVALWRAWATDVLISVNRTVMEITAMIFTILIGASLFSLVFRGLGGEELVREGLSAAPGGFHGALLIVMLIMFVLGFFLDFVEITFVVVPLVAPILLAIEAINPIWIGILMAINLQTSFLTPPFGFALFYLRGAAPDAIATTDLYRGAVPFVLIQVLALGLIAAFPTLATWLPSALFGTSFG